MTMRYNEFDSYEEVAIAGIECACDNLIEEERL